MIESSLDKNVISVWLHLGDSRPCQLGYWVPAEKSGFELNATFALVTQLPLFQPHHALVSLAQMSTSWH